jgi:hypothetical protein
MHTALLCADTCSPQLTRAKDRCAGVSSVKTNDNCEIQDIRC